MPTSICIESKGGLGKRHFKTVFTQDVNILELDVFLKNLAWEVYYVTLATLGWPTKS